MSIENCEVMQEFLRIAEKQDLLCLKKTAATEKNPYEEDIKTIEEKRQKSPEKSIIEIAHPEPVYVAEARGDGGLVENQIEQQKKLIEMLNKMPTGSLVGRYASAVVELIKVANLCDEFGHEDAADLVTAAATKLFGKIASDEEHCEKCGGYGFITNPEVAQLGPSADWYIGCPDCKGKTRDLHVTPSAFEEGPSKCPKCGGSGRNIGPTKSLSLIQTDTDEDGNQRMYDHGKCPDCKGGEDLPLTEAPTDL